MNTNRRGVLEAICATGFSILAGCSDVPYMGQDAEYKIITPQFDRTWAYKFQVETTSLESIPVTVSAKKGDETVASHTFHPTRDRSREAVFNKSPVGLTISVSSPTHEAAIEWVADTESRDLHPRLDEDVECSESDLRIVVPTKTDENIRFDWSCLD